MPGAPQLETEARTGNYDWKLPFKLESNLGGNSSVGEALAEFEEVVALGLRGRREARRSRRWSRRCGRPEAVPVRLVELEAGVVVVVERAEDFAGAVGLAAGERWHVGGGRDREQPPVQLAGGSRLAGVVDRGGGEGR